MKLKTEDITVLKKRLARLAAEKSRIELLLNMLLKLNSASDLEGVINHGLRVIVEVIGATNACLVVSEGGQYVVTDAFGQNERLESAVDPDIAAAYEHKRPGQSVNDFAATHMTYRTEYEQAFTWVYPLIVEKEVLGVIKVENTAYSLDEVSRDMDVFFGYLAQLIKNEVQNLDQLEAANRKLQALNAALERRVQARTFALENSNRALQRSEQKYRGILESMHDGVIICSSGLKIEYCNPAMTAILGRDITGETCHKALYESGAPCPDCVLAKTSQGERVVSEQTLPFGEGVYHVSHSPLLNADGSISNLTIYRDITRSKALEARLRQVQRMESIGNMAGGIAHDFNNLLFPITGMAELLMEDLPADSLMYANAGEILKAGLRGRDLVKQILAFSRQSKTEKLPVRLAGIVREVLSLCRATIPANIEILQAIEMDNRRVHADPSQLHQVVMNVVMNAFQALDFHYGRISISLREVLQKADAPLAETVTPGPYALLEVVDTGCGIAPEIMENVLEPYFTTREKERGTGLGLAVANGIIRDHGGDIRLYSEPGLGTTVRIWLPLIAHPTTAVFPESLEKLAAGSERILLVDDEQPILKTVLQNLQRLGYRVAEYGNPLEALAAFRATPEAFDLVITDMTMPTMTGLQLAENLQSVRSDIPIIITTGFSEKLSPEKAAAAGIRAILMKPITRVDLAQKVREMLDKTDTQQP